jgi:hypothetical protein
MVTAMHSKGKPDEWANGNWKTYVFLRQNENNWHHTFSDGWLLCKTKLLVRNFVSRGTVWYWIVQDLSCPTSTRLKEFYCITKHNLNDFIKAVMTYYYIIIIILPVFILHLLTSILHALHYYTYLILKLSRTNCPTHRLTNFVTLYTQSSIT